MTGDGETSKCRRVLVTTLAPSPQHHVTATYAWLVRRHADRHTDSDALTHARQAAAHTHTCTHRHAYEHLNTHCLKTLPPFSVISMLMILWDRRRLQAYLVTGVS